MANIPLDKFQILAPPVQFADIGIFIANAMADALEGAWFFNKFTGETDAQAMVRCSYNWAPGASNNEADRVWLTDAANGQPIVNPSFQPDHAIISNHQCLKTGLDDFASGTTGGCVFVLCKTDDATLGAVSADRGNICGHYGGNTARGSYIQYTTTSSGLIRASTYGVTAPTTGIINSVTLGAGIFDKWRLLFYHVGAAVKGTNLSGDGTTPDPAETAVAGAHLAGTLKFHIGGFPVAGSSQVFNNNLKKIAFVLRFKRIPTAGELTTITAQCRDLMSETTIKELATTP